MWQLTDLGFDTTVSCKHKVPDCKLVDQCLNTTAEMQLAAAQAEAEERTQAAAQASIPKDSDAEPSELSGQSQDASGQQPTAPEQAGQAPTGPQPINPPPVRKSVKESSSRSTLRFAERPTIAAMSDEDRSASGTGLIV